MGKAIAFDLVQSFPDFTVTLADVDLERASRVAASIDPKRISPQKIDAQNHGDVVRLMSQHTVAISAVTFHLNYLLTKAAIEAGSHFCDLGHDDGVVAQQLTETHRASHANIAIIANCGLAPGLADILAMDAFQQLDEVDSLHLRAGGLPQHPHPPLN